MTERERVELEYELTLRERRALLRRTYWLVRPSRWPRVGLAVWWPVILLAILPDHATVPESWGLLAPVGRGQAQATGNPFEAPR